jgi:hypothetical protein
MRNVDNCAFLGYYAASSGNFLPAFWDNLSVPSPEFRDQKGFFGFLNPEDGTDRLSRNFVKKFGFLNPEDETDRLSRIIGKKLSLLIAQ